MDGSAARRSEPWNSDFAGSSTRSDASRRVRERGCPFWESGSCAVDGVDLSGRSDLAAWLLRIRSSLDRARVREDEQEARRLFYRVLNEGQGE